MNSIRGYIDMLTKLREQFDQQVEKEEKDESNETRAIMAETDKKF